MSMFFYDAIWFLWVHNKIEKSMLKRSICEHIHMCLFLLKFKSTVISAALAWKMYSFSFGSKGFSIRSIRSRISNSSGYRKNFCKYTELQICFAHEVNINKIISNLGKNVKWILSVQIYDNKQFQTTYDSRLCLWTLDIVIQYFYF